MLAHVVESQKKVWKDVRSSPSGDYLENLSLKWCDKERHKIWDLNLSNTNFIVIVSVSVLFWRSKQRIKKQCIEACLVVVSYESPSACRWQHCSRI